MANRYYGLDRGHQGYVSEDSSTTSKDVEVVVDLSANMLKSEVIIKLQEIINYIVKGNWPPA
jgi:hypothetical protein